MLVSSILWTNADSTVSVMKPTEEARQKGETDAAFLSRAMATMTPASVVTAKRIVLDSAISVDAAFVASEAAGASTALATARAHGKALLSTPDLHTRLIIATCKANWNNIPALKTAFPTLAAYITAINVHVDAT